MEKEHYETVETTKSMIFTDITKGEIISLIQKALGVPDEYEASELEVYERLGDTRYRISFSVSSTEEKGP